MIAAWTLGVLVTAQSAQIVERVVPGSDRVTVSAVIGTPKFEAIEDPGKWESIRRALAYGARRYPRPELMSYTGIVGPPVKFQLGMDALTITLSLPKGNLDLATDIVGSLLGSPSFPEDATKDVLDETPFSHRTPWQLAWNPCLLRTNGLTREDLLDTWHRAVQPANVTLAVSGPFKLGEGLASMRDHLPDWAKVSKPRYKKPVPVPPSLTAELGDYHVVRLEGKIQPLSQTTRLMEVAMMLGTGKGASLFQRVRQQERLSYRQEASVQVGRNGAKLVVLVAIDKGDAEEAVKKLREVVSSSIKDWDEDDVRRIQGVGKGLIAHNLLPTVFTADGTAMWGRQEDLTQLSALFGRALELGDLVPGDSVDLKDLKDFASTTLEECSATVIVGP